MTSRAPLRNQKRPNRAPSVEFLRAPADLQGEALSVFICVFLVNVPSVGPATTIMRGIE